MACLGHIQDYHRHSYSDPNPNTNTNTNTNTEIEVDTHHYYPASSFGSTENDENNSISNTELADSEASCSQDSTLSIESTGHASPYINLHSRKTITTTVAHPSHLQSVSTLATDSPEIELAQSFNECAAIATATTANIAPPMSPKSPRKIIMSAPDLFPHQVGGHHIIIRHPTRPDCILKSYFPKEDLFYRIAQNHHQLASSISTYHGRINLKEYGDCIILEDLTYRMEEPCILDVKIGRRLYDDDATPEKSERMRRKAASSTSSSLGFRISGMRSLDPLDGHVVIRLKRCVRGISTDELTPMMSAFFSRLEREDAYWLVDQFIEQLRRIEEAVRETQSYLYASSILFLYDSENPREKWDCRMIDFVHSHIGLGEEGGGGGGNDFIMSKGSGYDRNYLDGLKNLIDFIQRLKNHL